MHTLFISDLHLCAERPAITELFLDFLRREAAQADTLYILGDLFEYWIGDDVVSQDEYRPIIKGLADLKDRGPPVLVMVGNRDFLMGPRFERETGCRMLADPSLIDLYGTPVLIMHGDTLCTDDVEYQKVRRMVRSEAWQRQVLAKSLAEREALSRQYRETSKMTTANMRPEIMDVNQQAVEVAMREHGVHHMIHGHTHRPAQHVFNLDGVRACRVVLGDWYNQGSVLQCDAKGWSLRDLPLPNAAVKGTARR